VADAFQTVSNSARYRGRWIAAYDWVRIIRHEYELPDECEFTEAMFNDTVCKDRLYTPAEDQFNPTSKKELHVTITLE
jgi:hypothetical protein